MLMELNQELVIINWNSEDVASKQNNNKQTKFKIINDQNNEKFLIKQLFVLSTNRKTIQGNNGNKIKYNSIKINVFTLSVCKFY